MHVFFQLQVFSVLFWERIWVLKSSKVNLCRSFIQVQLPGYASLPLGVRMDKWTSLTVCTPACQSKLATEWQHCYTTSCLHSNSATLMLQNRMEAMIMDVALLHLLKHCFEEKIQWCWTLNSQECVLIYSHALKMDPSLHFLLNLIKSQCVWRRWWTYPYTAIFVFLKHRRWSVVRLV